MGSRSLNQPTKRRPQRLSHYEECAPNLELHQVDAVCRVQLDANEALSILLIDDEPGIRLLLHKGLAAQGHRLYEANDGVTGVAQFHALQPDLILLDGNMPGMDGLAVLKEIRRYDVVVGIIMISAQSAKFLITEALLSGADRYLVKPLRLQHVLDEVQRVSTLVRQRRYHL